jgi:hypothetical protein
MIISKHEAFRVSVELGLIAEFVSNGAVLGRLRPANRKDDQADIRVKNEGRGFEAEALTDIGRSFLQSL